jgi:hypothetical protein
MFELVSIWNLNWIWIENPREKEMEKQIENPGKKKKPKQPSGPSSAQPGRAPALPDRWVPPISGGSLPRAPFLSLSLPSGTGLSAPVASALVPLFPSSLGPPHKCAEPLPLRARPLSLCVCVSWGRFVSFAFPAPAVDQHARTRTRTARSTTTSPTHAPPAPFWAPPAPALAPPSHFSQPRSLSRALSTLLDLAGDPRSPW